jgi:transposase
MSKNKKRRNFTEEFKAEVVALCKADDRPMGEIARELGLVESVVTRWVQKANGTHPSFPSPAAKALELSEREELELLRKENVRLRMEREILKKAAAFFAAENA